MTETTQVAAPAAPTEKQKESIRKLFAAYGVQNLIDLESTPAFQAALKASGGNKHVALRSLYRRKETTTLRGWFLMNRPLTQYDAAANGGKGAYVEKTRGPQILLPDGAILPIWTGKDLTGIKRMAAVEVRGVERVIDVETGLTIGDIQLTPATTIVAATGAAAAAMPRLPINLAVQRTMQRNKRGVPYGETSDSWHAIATGSIQEGSVDYFSPSEKNGNKATLKTVVVTSDGIPVQWKPDLQHTASAYGIQSGASKSDFAAALEGEPVLLNGRLKTTQWAPIENLEKEGLGEIAHALIGIARNYITAKNRVRKGVELKGLDLAALAKAMNEQQARDGKPPLDFNEGLQIGPYLAMDIREEEGPGQLVFYLRCRLPGDEKKWDGREGGPDASKWPLPTIDTYEHPWKSGEGVANAGAFAVFLAREADVVLRSDKDDAIEALLAGSF